MIKIEKEIKQIDYYFPEQISKYILEKLVKSARAYLDNKPIKKAVITVPAYFNNAQREATKLTANQEGLEVLRIINEPTAASLAYGLEKKLQKNKDLESIFFSIDNNSYLDSKNKNVEDEDDEKLIIVFDLGDGTFDITLLKIEDQEIFDVIATSGDSYLDGDDFGKRIIDFSLKEFCSKLKIDVNEIKNDTKAMNRLNSFRKGINPIKL